MQTTVSNHLPYSYLFAAGATGKICVPVSSAQLPYSNFRNVVGVPAGLTGGYSLDKLQILDTLIGHLRTVKQTPMPTAETARGSSPQRVDALIEEYSKQLHTALVAKSIPYAKPQGVMPGMMISVAA